LSEVRSVTIIGIGLIGGSLGLALKQLARVEHVSGVARKQKSLDSARIIGAIDAGYLDPAEAVGDADIVFIATPVSSIVDMAKQVIPHMKEGAILTDVGSTKETIVKEIEKAIEPGIHFIGGHPMAGSEMSGVEAANRDLFRNCSYILTPTGKTDLNALKLLYNLLSRTGARILSLDPQAHDRVAATVSHLPHILAAGLVNLASEEKEEYESIFQIAAGGFYDMTRIAASDHNIWVDICLENRKSILDILGDFETGLDEVKSLIAASDREGLVAWFESASDVRKRLKSGKPSEVDVYNLLIAIPNKPGVLSEITLAIGKIGINIEDVQIVHTTEGDTGVLKLAVFGKDEADRAAAILREKGYTLSVEGRFI
jgi:prephenate dehydrogenase